MSTFASLTRSQLQAAAKERGIKAGGTNAEIRARLEAAEGDTAGTSTPTTATDADSTANAITNDVDAAADAETTSSQPAAKKAKVESAGSAPAAAAASSSSAADADTAAADDTVVDVDLTGKKFIVMGGFTCGRFRIESTIANLGGEVAKNVVKSLNYIVCGVAERTEYGGVSGPGSKKFKEAKKLKIPVLDEAAFEQLVAAHEATQKRIKGSIQDALIPDLANLVDQFAGGGVAGEGAGAKWAEICDILRITDNVPATEEEITAAEEKLKLAFPLELKQLWRVARNQGMSDGGGSLLHEPHPAYFFPSIEEVLKTYSGENNDFKQYAPALFKELRFLALTNYYQAGDRLECIDLAQKFVVTLDFDHEGSGLWLNARSLSERIDMYHSAVLSRWNAFQAFKQAAAESSTAATDDAPQTELDLLRAYDVKLEEELYTPESFEKMKSQNQFWQGRKPEVLESTMRAEKFAAQRAAAGDDAKRLAEIDEEELVTLRRTLFSFSDGEYRRPAPDFESWNYPEGELKASDSYENRVWKVVEKYMKKLYPHDF